MNWSWLDNRLKILSKFQFVFSQWFCSQCYNDIIRWVWRYQRGKQTTQWPKEKVQKDKQRSTKHTHKTKDRVTRTSLKTGGELRCSGRVSSSCSTSGTRRVNLVTSPVISHEWGKYREVFTTSGTYNSRFLSTEMMYNHKISAPKDDIQLEILDTAIDVSLIS